MSVKIKRPLLLIFILGWALSLQAQQRGVPVYTDYLTDNLYLLFPSMAGAAQHSKVRLTGREQWSGVKDAPSLQTLTINGRLKGSQVGLGAILFNDRNGYFSHQGAYATFAYHLLFSRDEIVLNQLSFGLSVGVLQEKVDESEFSRYDPVLVGGKNKQTYFNVDFGLSYYYVNFFAHLAVKNIIPEKSDLFSSDLQLDNQRQYLFLTGFTLASRTEKWLFVPSVLLQYREATNEALGDLNGKVYRNFDWGQLWGGVSYRRSLHGAKRTLKNGVVLSYPAQFITPFLGVRYKHFVVAYTYTIQGNTVSMGKGGYHQITLGYNFGKARTRYHLSPTINH